MEIKEMTSPILITGCGRSGSSMIAGAIRLCGAFGGNTLDPAKYAERGMFENAKVREQVVEPYFLRSGLDPTGQFPLPNIYRLYIPRDWKQKVCATMYDDGLRDQPWFYKSSKLCLTWPIWNYAFPNAKWIIVRRRTGDIISSCLKTNFMKAFNRESIRGSIGVKSERDGWLWWVRQHEKRFVEMINEGLNCKMIWPHRMVYGDYQQMMEMIDWLGLKWNSEVLGFIDPKFWKVRKKSPEQLVLPFLNGAREVDRLGGSMILSPRKEGGENGC
jgi:hypothetical protein